MNAADVVTPDSWKAVLSSAVAILDDLERREFRVPGLVMGGGTVLMFRYEHRLSRDIDFFMHDVQWLSFFSPRLNDAAAAMTTNYVEQPNSIKLKLREGDIDIVVARSVTTTAAVETLKFMGRTFFLESSEEILAKKLFYRTAFFQPRDAFDMAAAIEFDRPSAIKAVRATASKIEILNRRLDELAQMPRAEFDRDILPLERGKHLIDQMISRTRDFIRAEVPG